MHALKSDKLKEFVDRIDAKNACLIIVDEVSMFTPFLLSVLDHRLKQARTSSKDVPFGGVSILLMGDFMQLPPVGGTPLYAAAIKQAMNPEKFPLNTPFSKGINLFNQFTLTTLTQQQRCKSDQVHTDMVQRMSQGKDLSHKDLANFPCLSQKDFEDDQEWKFAPVVVTSNQERLEFIFKKAKQFAALKGKHVIRWPLMRKTWKNKPNLDLFPEAEEDPALWGYFVESAPGYLCSNINPEIQLANGSPIEYHSVSYTCPNQRSCLRQMLKHTPIGGVVTMKTAPNAINVRLYPNDPQKQKNWKYATLVKNDAVVPVIFSSKYVKAQQVWIRGGQGFDPSKVETLDCLAVEMGFAITFHKAQGRTILRLILALSKRPNGLKQISHSGLLVVLSRVQERAHIRLLCKKGEDLSYLTNLHCSDLLLAWRAGFTNAKGKWDSQTAIDHYQELEEEKSKS